MGWDVVPIFAQIKDQIVAGDALFDMASFQIQREAEASPFMAVLNAYMKPKIGFTSYLFRRHK